jgi:hypothetical protein
MRVGLRRVLQCVSEISRVPLLRRALAVRFGAGRRRELGFKTWATGPFGPALVDAPGRVRRPLPVGWR